jgi:hypothetical protein
MRASRSLLQWALCLVVLLLAACGSNDGADTSNFPPTASVKIPVSTFATAVVTLDGSASSANGGRTLTYSWALTSAPAGSVATITNPTTVQPTLTPDLAGNYTVALTVSDGKQSTRASATILASAITNAITSSIAEPESGIVTLGFTFDPGVTTVDWSVDGVALGSGAATQRWDTTTVANGSHLVRAHLTVAANNYTYDITRTFQVGQSPVSFTGTTATEVLGAVTAITGAQSTNGIVRVVGSIDGVAIGTLTAPNACLDATGAACATAGLNGYQFTGIVASGLHTVLFTATDGGGNSLGAQVFLSVTDVP